PVFTSNDDNAALAFPGGEDWLEPWTAHHSSIGDDYMAKPLVDTMLFFSDPRLAFYADTISDGTYKGLVVGVRPVGEYSAINDLFVNNPAGSVYFMKYSELEFIRAEAAERGLAGVPGDAAVAYNAAISASCEEYGIGLTEITNFIGGADVAYAGDINQIYVQKWISLFRQSWEAWAEMRRTDVPVLPLAAGATVEGHNRVPFRFSYPGSEKKLNSNNIPEYVNEVDNYWGYQIWWDTRTGVQ
ncbi:MAG: SusD/RagB family nutrient-binding outer membrane lipoprotein, partial [Bacteroidota bacterium]|nr:SusD/RagB family nutrient-binding outer membrane lipoprotein [Bacteroidota bacterium]